MGDQLPVVADQQAADDVPDRAQLRVGELDQWRHVRSNTLLIEQKLVRGQIIAGQKTARSIRTIKLLGPLAQDLAEYRAQTGATGLLFPKPDGGPWLDHDFRNWRSATSAPRLRRSVSSLPGHMTCAIALPRC